MGYNGSRERDDTRYVLQPRVNLKTGRETQQVWLDPDCKKAKRKARAAVNRSARGSG